MIQWFEHVWLKNRKFPNASIFFFFYWLRKQRYGILPDKYVSMNVEAVLIIEKQGECKGPLNMKRIKLDHAKKYGRDKQLHPGKAHKDQWQVRNFHAGNKHKRKHKCEQLNMTDNYSEKEFIFHTNYNMFIKSNISSNINE